MSAPTDATVQFSVLIVEDIRVLRDGLADQLCRCGMRVAAAVRSANDAVGAAVRLRPEAVLVDAASAGADGPALVAAVLASAPDTHVVAMDLLPRQADVIAYIRAGAAGFVMRDAEIDEIATVLRRVVGGDRVLPAVLAGRVFDWIAGVDSRRVPVVVPPERLTGRERQVCELVAQGLSNKEIAARLHIATHTVKSHVHSVLGKLALRTRLDIVSTAHQLGNGARRGHDGAREDLVPQTHVRE